MPQSKKAPLSVLNNDPKSSAKFIPNTKKACIFIHLWGIKKREKKAGNESHVVNDIKACPDIRIISCLNS
jgi:hypothetical protein